MLRQINGSTATIRINGAQLKKQNTGEGKEGHDTLTIESVSYTHLRAHETEADLVCRLLLE